MTALVAGTKTASELIGGTATTEAVAAEDFLGQS